MYPRSGGTSAKTTLLETTLLSTQIPCFFFERFSLLLLEFRGSIGIRNPCFFFVVFRAFFQKKQQGKEGQGRGGTQTNADFRLCEKGPKAQVDARKREQPRRQTRTLAKSKNYPRTLQH